MKIILLKDVKGVGKRFEEREVANGHATNFLIPRGLAVASTASSAAQTRSLKESEEKSREKAGQVLNEKIASLAGTKVELKVAADEKGHLFEKLTSSKLAKLTGVDAEFIVLESPIKELGSHTIKLRAGEKETHFTLEVAPRSEF